MTARSIPISSLIRSDLLRERITISQQKHILTKPAAGDIILAQVVDSEGPYSGIEIAPDARYCELSEGDQFVGVLGNRQSAVNLTGHVPTSPIANGATLNLLAVAGMIGIVDKSVQITSRPARSLQFIAALEDVDGKVLSIRNFPKVDRAKSASEETVWVVVCGASAEVGKTTVVEKLIAIAKGFHKSVGAAKLSGTGRNRDKNRYTDAGAAWSYDFVDAGYESTYRLTDAELLDIIAKVTETSASTALVVMEFGGDLLEAGVPRLVDLLMPKNPNYVFVSRDAMSSLKALEILSGYKVSIVTRDLNPIAVARRLQISTVYDANSQADLKKLLLEIGV